MKRIELFGVPIDLLSQEDALAFVEGRIREKKKTFITTPNPEFIVDAQHDPAFRAILQKADLALPDGIGSVWALRFLRLQHVSNLSHWANWSHMRIAGVDFMLALCSSAAEENWTVSLLGGGPKIAEKTREVLTRRFPGIKISVILNASQGESEESREPMVQRSRSFALRELEWAQNDKKDLLFVALGHKKQERFIVEKQTRLGATVAMGVGGAFDYISGAVLRAPTWIRNAGLEWLFRLVVQPWRIRRQWKLLVFVVLVLREFFFRT